MSTSESNFLVSIIVPVYNRETYLATCLDSITQQTYTNLEIIIIDDCSTDNSHNIIQSYATKDSRIRTIYNKENVGIGVVRDIGNEAATGKYVWHIDSDDYIDTQAVQILVANAIQYDYPDIIQMQMQNRTFSAKPKKIGKPYPFIQTGFITKNIIEENTHVLGKYTLDFAITNKFFKLSFIKKTNLKTSSIPQLGEDAYFTTSSLYYIKSFLCLAKPLYFYHPSEQSITRNLTLEKRYALTQSILKVAENLETEPITKHYPHLVKQRIHRLFVFNGRMTENFTQKERIELIETRLLPLIKEQTNKGAVKFIDMLALFEETYLYRYNLYIDKETNKVKSFSLLRRLYYILRRKIRTIATLPYIKEVLLFVYQRIR